jgi:glutaredoxin
MYEVIALEECPYSIRAVKLLKALSQKNPKLKYKVVWVNETNKHQYKTPERPSFPQISFHVKSSKGINKIYIGGCEQFENLCRSAESLRAEYGPQIIVPLLQLMSQN